MYIFLFDKKKEKREVNLETEIYIKGVKFRPKKKKNRAHPNALLARRDFTAWLLRTSDTAVFGS